MDYSWHLTEVAAGFKAFVLAPGSRAEEGLQNALPRETMSGELVSPGVVTTRRGGVSKGPFEELNVSFRVGDDPVTVIGNRDLVAWGLGLEAGACARPEQIHGDLVLGVDSPGDYAGADGLVCSSGGLWLSVHVADCVPVFVFRPDLSSVGLAHAGRKGTAAGITANLINVFKSSCQCNVSELVVALGPSVGPCCYELDQATAERLRADCVERRRGRLFFDLWKANRLQALEEGVSEKNVVMPPACTSCRSDILFSHRAHGGRTGRQMAVARPGGIRLRQAAAQP